MKVLSDILHKAGILKENAEAYSSGGYSVLVRNNDTQRVETVPATSFVSDNIYTANGTIAGNRVVNLDSKQLIFRDTNATLTNYTTSVGTPTGVTFTWPMSVVYEGQYDMTGASPEPYNTIVWARNKGASARTFWVNQVYADVTGESTGATGVYNQWFVTRRGSSLDTSTTTNGWMLGVVSQVGHLHTTNQNSTTTNITTPTQEAIRGEIINYLGTVTNSTSVRATCSVGYSSVSRSATVTNHYGFKSDLSVGFILSNPCTLTNYYGLFLSTPTVGAGGSITNRWGVYAPDSAMRHHLNGNVIIGSTTDAGYKLDVSGVTRSSTRYIAGTFTPGGGVTSDDKIISDGFVRAAGLNMRSPIVGDNIFIGFQSGSGDIQLWANNANVGQINAVGAGPGSVLRIGGYGYNPGAGQSGFRNSILINNAISPTGNNTADYVMVHLNPQVDEQDINGTYTSGSLRGVYYNPSITLLNTTTHFAWESTAGKFKISDLAGTGSRMVTVDSSGVLSTSALPTSTNIYNSDGTLTGNRTVTLGGSSLTFSSSRTTGFATNINVTQTQPNGGDPGDGSISVSHSISASSATSQNVIRAMSFGSNNDLTGGGSITNHRVWNVASSTQSGTFTSDLDQIFIERGNQANGTVTNNRAIRVNTMQGTNRAGFACAALSGTNNVYALLGTVTIPTGNWGVYQSESSFNNHFNGNVIIGGTTDAGYKLDVQGTARVTDKLYIRGNGISTSGDDTFNLIAYGNTRMKLKNTSGGGGQLDFTWEGNAYTTVSSAAHIVICSVNTASFGAGSGSQTFIGYNGLTDVVTPVAIGKNSWQGINASAILEVSSTTKGFLPPRMTGAQVEAIASPAEGLLAYATNAGSGAVTSSGWWGYNGTTWVKLN